MKKFKKKQIGLFAVFFVLYSFAYSQNVNSVNNFHIKNNRVVWQKVYKTSLEFEELLTIVMDEGLLDNIQKEKAKIRGDIKYMDAEPLEYKFINFNTPTYIYKNFIKGFVVIDYKPERYRVTLKRILMVKKNTDTLNTLPSSTSIEKEAYKLGKIGFNNHFKKHSSNTLNEVFTNYFNFNPIIHDDNW